MENIVGRLKEYLEFKGINVSSAEKAIGISNSSLSKPFNNKTSIKTETLESFLKTYSDISPEWLLTGIGNMLKESDGSLQVIGKGRRTKDSVYDNQEIPLYDLEAVAGLKELFQSGQPQKILDTIKIPNLPKCDGAISVTGDSMYPLLKSGDIVLYKETTLQNVFFGEMYLLSVKLDEWEEYITVKYVQKSDEGKEYVKLVSQNSHHQPKDIHVSQISALALIKASIRINTML